MENLTEPSGPAMAMEGEERVRPMARWPLCRGAGRMSKVTPGGMDRGALPMLEQDRGVVLNVREDIAVSVLSIEERRLRRRHIEKDAIVSAKVERPQCDGGTML